MPLWLQFFLIILFPLGELVLLAALARERRRNPSDTLVLLMVVLALDGLWATGLASDFVGRGVNETLLSAWRKIAQYALPFAAAALLVAMLGFLRRRVVDYRRWLALLVAGVAIVLLLDPDIVPVHIQDLRLAGRVISHRGWWRLAWSALWAIPAASALGFSLRDYPRKAGPIHRNRARYWVLVAAIHLVGGGLALSEQPTWVQGGALVKLLGGFVATVSLLALRLPDMRIILRQAVSVVVISAMTVALFLVGMLGAQRISVELAGRQTVFWATAGLALTVAAVYLIVRPIVHKLVTSIVIRDVYDLDRVLRDYGQDISQTLELKQVAQTMIEAVDDALHIDHGALALVQYDGSGTLNLTPALAIGVAPVPSMSLAADSPLARRIAASDDPLAQYDLDVLPEFAGLPSGEREMLSRWEAELYVPIHSHGKLAGLLALGTKRSRDPYLDSDITLLMTLADQTAVALENARLFADLKALNREITELNTSLEQANLELLELDKLKSSFIGMITHELRSPFVPIDLALQLVERHGLEHMLPEQREQIEVLDGSVSDLRRLVDNLISFASLVQQTGDTCS